MALSPPSTFTGFLVGFAETLANQLEMGGVEALTPEEVSKTIRLCAFFQQEFAQARQSLVTHLTRGVDGRAFAAKFEGRVVSLEAILAAMNRVVTEARTNPVSSQPEEFLSSLRALMDEILQLHGTISHAVAAAKIPIRPDWKKMQEADEAYARGETKPFQRRSPKG